MLEIFVQRPKEDVESAIVQFVARRSYRLSKPWHIDGLRIEAPSDSPDMKPGFWAKMLDTPVVPRIEVVTKSRRSGTRVRVNIANTPESTRLASELHAFLLDARSYDRRIPTLCPRCSCPVNNVTARYCGRCGYHLTGDVQEPVPRSMIPPPVATRPTVAIERNAAEPQAAAPIRSTLSYAEDEMEQSFEWPDNRKKELTTPKTGDDAKSSNEAASDVEQELQPSPASSEADSEPEKKAGMVPETSESEPESAAVRDEMSEREIPSVSEPKVVAEIETEPEAESDDSATPDDDSVAPDQTNERHRRALAEE